MDSQSLSQPVWKPVIDSNKYELIISLSCYSRLVSVLCVYWIRLLRAYSNEIPPVAFLQVLAFVWSPHVISWNGNSAFHVSSLCIQAYTQTYIHTYIYTQNYIQWNFDMIDSFIAYRNVITSNRSSTVYTYRYLLYSTCVPLKIVHDCNFQLFHLRFRSSWQRLLLDAPCHVSTAHAQCVFCLRRNSESRQISPNKAKHKRKTVNHLYHGLEMASHVNFLPSNTWLIDTIG